jgi:probable HAF family extracellular repeat protein
MQSLGTLGGPWSSAFGINARGQVVGESATVWGPFSNDHAFLWEAGTGMQDLGTLAGDWSGASDINARGQVVGWSESATAPNVVRAVLWKPGPE